MAKQKGRLYLIPTPITENALQSISPEVIKVIHGLDHFIVEKARTARRFISATKHPKPIDTLMVEEMTENGNEDVDTLLRPLEQGINIGLMSEAGLPAIADPGNLLVMQCQKRGIDVIPLAGPSSLFMALMASGLQGQRFCFHGYLSAKKNELPLQLKNLQLRADQDDATQLWIETPYRNHQILDAVEKYLDPGRLFCIAANIGDESGFVRTKRIADWKKVGWPEIHKVPVVFLLR